MSRIIVCGLNGAGKSTFGRVLARELEYRFHDIEEYYYSDLENGYRASRKKDEVSEALFHDLDNSDRVVLAAVAGHYGKRVEELFSCAVYLEVPHIVRMKRIRDRSFRQFGERMLPGGDLFEQEEIFFKKVDEKPDNTVDDWLNGLNIPVIRVDGTKPLKEMLCLVVEKLLAFDLLG